MESRLEWRVARVTGASRGIGAAVATRLAREGASVAINYVQGANKASELADELGRAGFRAMTIRGKEES